jgi:hypothetical protein
LSSWAIGATVVVVPAATGVAGGPTGVTPVAAGVLPEAPGAVIGGVPGASGVTPGTGVAPEALGEVPGEMPGEIVVGVGVGVAVTGGDIAKEGVPETLPVPVAVGEVVPIVDGEVVPVAVGEVVIVVAIGITAPIVGRPSALTGGGVASIPTAEPIVDNAGAPGLPFRCTGSPLRPWRGPPKVLVVRPQGAFARSQSRSCDLGWRIRPNHTAIESIPPAPSISEEAKTGGRPDQPVSPT